jgi:hypothetical protein
VTVTDSTQDEGTRTELESKGVELGPLFTGGALLVALGLIRRRKLAVAAGLGAIWLDQRSKFGRDLKERFKQRVKERAKAPSTS